MQSNLRLLLLKAGIIIFGLLWSFSTMAQQLNPWPSIGVLPLPAGYHRIPADAGSFAGWLRNIPLKKDRTVYLFNGSRKPNQTAQFAVLDISVGKQDLQQCADAVMRLRAEYLFAAGRPDAIRFYTEQGVALALTDWLHGQRFHLASNRLVAYHTNASLSRRALFDDYLNTVFTYCGTRTLEKQLLPTPMQKIAAGDVLIRGGSPGHAMLVVDLAEDNHGNRIFLLAQSYMPAQDIHIVNNPTNPALSPWYLAERGRISGTADNPGDGKGSGLVEAPEYTFRINELRSWPALPGKF